MSFLDRLAECTAHDLGRFVPWQVQGARAGLVRRDLLPYLLETRDGQGRAVFLLDGDPDGGGDAPSAVLRMASHLADFDARSAALTPLVRRLENAGLLVAPANGEMYPVADHHEAEPWLQLERAAMPSLGARAYGVHLHGYVRKADGLHMWIGRRSRHKTTHAGQLDNMVAGGQPLGLTPDENMVKECDEEAAVPAELAATAVRTGALRYRVEIEAGLRDDTLWLYDLELPEDFVPHNTDGEVEAFELWPLTEVAARVADTQDFKFNCNLTIIDFLMRHGALGDEHPEFADLRAGLTALPP